MKTTILIIEDDQTILHFMTSVLESNDYIVYQAICGYDGIHATKKRKPDVILLDLGLSDMDGMDVLQSIRMYTQTPILIVSSRSQENDKVNALDLGADDYITKPFGTPELLARIRSALRHVNQRNSKEKQLVFKLRALVIDYDKHLILLNQKNIHMTRTEYNILCCLARNVGKVVTYDALVKEVWGQYESDTQILRVNMANIRRKIEKNPGNPEYIMTEVGVGYRMV